MLKHTLSVIILVLCFTAHFAAFRIVMHHQHHWPRTITGPVYSSI